LTRSREPRSVYLFFDHCILRSGHRNRLRKKALFERCQSEQHPTLSPPHVTSFVREKPALSKVEVAARMTHVMPCPLKELLAQHEVISPQVSQFDQGDEALRDGMNINRVSPIVVVLCYAARLKKVVPVKIPSLIQTFFEHGDSGNSGNPPECNQVVPGMKVINPLL